MNEPVHALRVRALRWESDRVISVELDDPTAHRQLPPWEPGAHIDVHLPNGLERQYSLCGDPDAPTWRVAVLHEQGRGGSAYVHEQLRPGDLLDVVGPRNHFALKDATAYVFIAGGIGITPILAMVERCASLGKRWRLIYGGRSRASMAFLDELSAHGDLVEVVPEDERGLLDLRTALPDDAPESAAVYCCGPAGLLDAVTTRAAGLGIECHTERFTPVMSAQEARTGDSFDVVLKRTGLTLRVNDGESILDVVEGAGVMHTSSCREGTCGSCETAVISGVVDHRDGILTDDERRESATMMICVSRAGAAELELDL